MHNKGQLISLDFLFATILVIFSLGMLIGMAELRMYEIKEGIIYDDLQEKTEAAMIILSGGSLVGCVTDNGAILPFSYDDDAAKTAKVTKANLGLTDYNVSLQIGGATILNDSLQDTKNTLSVDLSMIKCSDNIKINQLKTANVIKAELKVGR